MWTAENGYCELWSTADSTTEWPNTQHCIVRAAESLLNYDDEAAVDADPAPAPEDEAEEDSGDDYEYIANQGEAREPENAPTPAPTAVGLVDEVDCDGLHSTMYECTEDFASHVDGVADACFAMVSAMLPGNFPACYRDECDITTAESMCYGCKQDVYAEISNAIAGECSSNEKVNPNDGPGDGNDADSVAAAGEATGAGGAAADEAKGAGGAAVGEAKGSGGDAAGEAKGAGGSGESKITPGVGTTDVTYNGGSKKAGKKGGKKDAKSTKSSKGNSVHKMKTQTNEAPGKKGEKGKNGKGAKLGVRKEAFGVAQYASVGLVAALAIFVGGVIARRRKVVGAGGYTVRKYESYMQRDLQ